MPSTGGERRESLIRRTNRAARASNRAVLTTADCAVLPTTDQFMEQEMVAFDRDNIGQCRR
jgi:hypothetical protein